MPRKTSTPSKYSKGEIYRHNGNEFYKVNDVRDLEYDNKSFRHYINDNNKLNKSYDSLKVAIDNHKENIINFIYNVTGIEMEGDLNTLIAFLDTLLVINNDNEYDYIILDDDGYIMDIKSINGIISTSKSYPNDILKGYYKMDNNTIVKDDKRYYELYNTL